jgi:outer membrane biosynthesis protein TonB
MGRLRLFGAAIVLALGVLSFGLVPAAAGDPGKASPPGQEKTPPGQAAKAENADESKKAEQATPPGQLDKETAEPAPVLDAPTQADEGKPAPAAEAPSSHSKAEKPKQDHAHEHGEQPASKPARSQSSHGNSTVAHTHVIICHRTGSAKNPYVVINISKSAWLEGHTTHPVLNGHSDILLKEGATPGEKMPRSACGQSEQPTAPQPPPVDVNPKPKPDPKPDPKPADKPGDPSVPSTPASTPTVIPPATQGRPVSSAGAGGAAVAGEVEVLAVDELPFTGMPLWLAVFGGCLLLGTGLAMRKASWAPEGSAQGAPVSTSSKKADTISR